MSGVTKFFAASVFWAINISSTKLLAIQAYCLLDMKFKDSIWPLKFAIRAPRLYSVSSSRDNKTGFRKRLDIFTFHRL
jgi:hypothetical protein